MPENFKPLRLSQGQAGAMEKSLPKGSVLKKLIRLFRSNTVIRHHFQVGGFSKPQGTAKAFFKNAYSYHSSVIPGYSAYDRFARYSDYAEMESYPILSNALNIFADEVTQKNEDNKILTIVSEDEEIQRTLEQLFDAVLHLNGKNGWKLVRNLLKYGDAFYLIDVTEENGIINLIQMPANEVEREEGFDKDEPSAIRFRWTAKQNIEIPNAYVAHFRLDGNDMFHPYGQSVLEPARRPWRQLVLLEDSMMVYRITRAPERRIFFLDVMGSPPEDIPVIVNKFNETIKKQKVVDDQGRIDLRYGATLSVDEDYIIPVRGGESGTRIDTLPGGQNLGDIEDIEFIRANLFSALGIPKAFLTFDQDMKSKQVLTQEDIRFARTVARVQEVLIAEFVKIAMIHLYVKGYRGEELIKFNIRMTNPSTVAEIQKMELWRARMDLVMSSKDGVFDTTFIYKNFLRLTNDAVEKIRKGQIQDKMFQAKLLQIENAQGMMNPGAMGMAGGMPPMGGMGGASLGGLPAPGGMGGAPGNMMGEPEVPGMSAGGGLAGESAGMKDLHRVSSGDLRTKEKRGLGGTDLTVAGDVDSDPNDMEGIKRTITSPMGGREAVETKNKQIMEDLEKSIKYMRSLTEEKEQQNKTIFPMGLSANILKNTFGEHIGKKGMEQRKINTKNMLTEATEYSIKQFNDVMEWENQLQELEQKSNKVIAEVYKLNK